jgi:hypothetical protein
LLLAYPLLLVLCQSSSKVGFTFFLTLGHLWGHTGLGHRLDLSTFYRSSSSCLVSYGSPGAHYLGGYQDRLLGGPLGLPDLCRTVPDGVRRKDYGGVVLG